MLNPFRQGRPFNFRAPTGRNRSSVGVPSGAIKGQLIDFMYESMSVFESLTLAPI
jgi:hypothetical protein